MITADQLAHLVAQHSDRMGMPMTVEQASAKLAQETALGEFLQALADSAWNLGYLAGKPRRLSAKQKSNLFNQATRQGWGVMHAIVNTEREILENA